MQTTSENSNPMEQSANELASLLKEAEEAMALAEAGAGILQEAQELVAEE